MRDNLEMMDSGNDQSQMKKPKSKKITEHMNDIKALRRIKETHFRWQIQEACDPKGEGNLSASIYGLVSTQELESSVRARCRFC